MNTLQLIFDQSELFFWKNLYSNEEVAEVELLAEFEIHLQYLEAYNHYVSAMRKLDAMDKVLSHKPEWVNLFKQKAETIRRVTIWD